MVHLFTHANRVVTSWKISMTLVSKTSYNYVIYIFVFTATNLQLLGYIWVQENFKIRNIFRHFNKVFLMMTPTTKVHFFWSLIFVCPTVLNENMEHKSRIATFCAYIWRDMVMGDVSWHIITTKPTNVSE